MGMVVITGVGPRTGTSYVMFRAMKKGLPVIGYPFLEGWHSPKHNLQGYWEIDPFDVDGYVSNNLLEGKVVKLWNESIKDIDQKLIDRILVLERRDKKAQYKSIQKVLDDERDLKYAGPIISKLNLTPEDVMQRSVTGISKWITERPIKTIKHVYTEEIDNEINDIIKFLERGPSWESLLLQ